MLSEHQQNINTDLCDIYVDIFVVPNYVDDVHVYHSTGKRSTQTLTIFDNSVVLVNVDKLLLMSKSTGAPANGLQGLGRLVGGGRKV